MRVLRFFFEYGGPCLWAGDAATEAALGYAVDKTALPISRALADELEALEAEFQTSLDWSDPATPSPWTKEHQTDFAVRAGAAYDRLVRELDGAYAVRNKSHL